MKNKCKLCGSDNNGWCNTLKTNNSKVKLNNCPYNKLFNPVEVLDIIRKICKDKKYRSDTAKLKAIKNTLNINN